MLALLPIDKLHIRSMALRHINRRDPDYIVLRESIRDWGDVIVPLTVRPHPKISDEYEILSGGHRYDICKCLGFPEIDCKIMKCTDEEADRIELEANATKVEPKPIEYTRRLVRLIQRNPDIKFTTLCDSIHRSVRWIKENLKLMRLNDNILRAVIGSELSMRNALNLAKLKRKDQDEYFLLAKRLSNRRFADLVKERIHATYDARRPTAAFQLTAIEPRIRKHRLVMEVYKDPAKLLPLVQNFESKEAIVRVIISWVLQMDTETLEKRNKVLMRLKRQGIFVHKDHRSQ